MLCVEKRQCIDGDKRCYIGITSTKSLLFYLFESDTTNYKKLQFYVNRLNKKIQQYEEDEIIKKFSGIFLYKTKLIESYSTEKLEDKITKINVSVEIYNTPFGRKFK